MLYNKKIRCAATVYCFHADCDITGSTSVRDGDQGSFTVSLDYIRMVQFSVDDNGLVKLREIHTDNHMIDIYLDRKCDVISTEVVGSL